MKTIKLTPAVSNKPCDIEYRLKRAIALASECAQFLEGIDTDTPIGPRLTEARQLARDAQALIGQMRADAPAKRIHGKKAKAAAGIVDEPKAPKAKRGRKGKTRDTVVEAVDAPDLELATLDAALEAAAE